MNRSIVLALLVAVATAGLGTFSFPARAEDPADEQAKPARQVKRAQGQLWWNDPAVVEKVGLSVEQRSTFDREFETFQGGQPKRGAGRQAQEAFHEALVQGDADRARSNLDAMVSSMRKPAEALGALKIRIFSELSQEQRDLLASDYPRVVKQAWTPRASWKGGNGQKRPLRQQPQR